MLPATLPTCMSQGYSSWHTDSVSVSPAAEPPPAHRLCTLAGAERASPDRRSIHRWARESDASPRPGVSSAPTAMGLERGGGRAAAHGTHLAYTAPRSAHRASCLQPELPPNGGAAAYQWPGSHYMHAIGPLHSMPQLRSTVARDQGRVAVCGHGQPEKNRRRRAHLKCSCLEGSPVRRGVC